MDNGQLLNRFFGGGLPRNSKRLKEILELRLILEPEIAALAARNATDKDLSRFRDILAGQKRNLEAGNFDPDEDMHFHISLARSTRNEVLLEVAAVLQDILSESRSRPLQSRERGQLSLDGHTRVIQALEARDPEGARQAMRAHLAVLEKELCADPAPRP